MRKLTRPGLVAAVGLNDHGQLGDGATENRATPVRAVGLSWGVLAISATGDFACALTSPSTAKCWGKNDHGQLGNGSVADSHVPVAVRALTRFGAVKCWGRNQYGQLGNGSTTDLLVPTKILTVP